jgi:hypothetical protein
MPTVDTITIADQPEVWRDAGFAVDGDTLQVGSVLIRLAGVGEGRGITGCTMREIAHEQPDGLPIARSPSERPPEPAETHPNGVRKLDHLVAVSADLDRTASALEGIGLDLRRVRDEPTPGGAPRQAFFRAGEVILELVQRPPRGDGKDDGDAPPLFWGLAFRVEDLDQCAAVLGDRLGEPRDAVQPGRRIATLRREAGIGTAVAFMS